MNEKIRFHSSFDNKIVKHESTEMDTGWLHSHKGVDLTLTFQAGNNMGSSCLCNCIGVLRKQTA